MRVLLRSTGVLMIALGLAMALFAGYLIWGTAAREAAAQRRLAGQLRQAWSIPQASAGSATRSAGPIRLTVGQPFAFLRIPALGAHWRFAVIEGTGLPQLALGPGHVPGTALPGQVGNFAVAGHRVTAGNPFWNLPGLAHGTLVYVDVRERTYVYRITGGPARVPPGDDAVLAPVPLRPRARPRLAMITLITCDPAWTGTSRVILTGTLARTATRPGPG